jgi:hypothetical protein
MDWIRKGQAVVPEGWDVYTSGGGCYHTSKTVEGIAVEVADEGFANIYKRDDDKTYAETVEEVYEHNYDPNFVVICELNYNGIFVWYEDAMFSDKAKAEIQQTVTEFAKIFRKTEDK